jgi:hypothetical protein
MKRAFLLLVGLLSILLHAQQNERGRNRSIVEECCYIQLCDATKETPHPELTVLQFENTPSMPTVASMPR